MLVDDNEVCEVYTYVLFFEAFKNLKFDFYHISDCPFFIDGMFIARTIKGTIELVTTGNQILVSFSFLTEAYRLIKLKKGNMRKHIYV